MAKDSAHGGATLRSVEELSYHAQKEHGLEPSDARGAPGPQQGAPGFICALCGAPFASKGILIRHALGPHYRTNRSVSWVSAQPI
ncbi:MAG: hypothetical protein WAN87_05445 [Thermoplasmata archaeon]